MASGFRTLGLILATRKELANALGMKPSASARQVENAAIRALCVGGDDVLDALEKVNRLANRLRERKLAGQREAFSALESLKLVKLIMVDVLRNSDIETETVDIATRRP